MSTTVTPIDFARNARTLSLLVQSNQQYGLEELVDLASLLAALCAAAYRLPDSVVDESESLARVHESERDKVAERLAAGLPQDLYRSIDPLDIYSDVGPTIGQLSDDVTDTWAELVHSFSTRRSSDHRKSVV